MAKILNKKDLAEFEKIKKKINKIITKSISPPYCSQLLSLEIDENLINNTTINIFLFSNNYKFVKKIQKLPYMISFIRDELKIIDEKPLQIKTELNHVLQEEILFFLPPIKYSIFKSDAQVEEFSLKCLELLNQKFKLFFCIFNSKSKRLNYNKILKNLSNFSNVFIIYNKERKEDEEEEEDEEVIMILKCFVKSIAEKKFKQETNKQDLTHSTCFQKDVANIENKLEANLAWKKMIMSYNNVGSDVADAIIFYYSSPSALYKAYSNCKTEKEKEKLLENIEVRRGSGVVRTCRKIGPQLSKKIFITLLSDNPNQFIE